MTARRVLFASLLLVLPACAQSFDATSLGVPATMASLPGEAAQGEAFRVNSSSVYAAWGLLTLNTASLEKVVGAQLVGGRQVSNLKIRVRSRWSDLLITGLTLGLVIPRTVTFEGVVTGAVADTTGR